MCVLMGASWYRHRNNRPCNQSGAASTTPTHFMPCIGISQSQYLIRLTAIAFFQDRLDLNHLSEILPFLYLSFCFRLWIIISELIEGLDYYFGFSDVLVSLLNTGIISSPVWTTISNLFDFSDPSYFLIRPSCYVIKRSKTNRGQMLKTQPEGKTHSEREKTTFKNEL